MAYSPAIGARARAQAMTVSTFARHRAYSTDRTAALTTQGIQKTAYILLLGLVIYVWAVGG
ncbi:MAG: hypothetical protein HLUCCA12_04035 [Rhodobacteraceae bacterium HLUCCA12]|nr:MAG: hypothetical protein HLUCCA12_04035 [Rhodobacteraceae bacterium HLUCCA12]